jgi:hypothetical protein
VIGVRGVIREKLEKQETLEKGGPDHKLLARKRKLCKSDSVESSHSSKSWPSLSRHEDSSPTTSRAAKRKLAKSDSLDSNSSSLGSSDSFTWAEEYHMAPSPDSGCLDDTAPRSVARQHKRSISASSRPRKQRKLLTVEDAAAASASLKSTDSTLASGIPLKFQYDFETNNDSDYDLKLSAWETAQTGEASGKSVGAGALQTTRHRAVEQALQNKRQSAELKDSGRRSTEAFVLLRPSSKQGEDDALSRLPPVIEDDYQDEHTETAASSWNQGEEGKSSRHVVQDVTMPCIASLDRVAVSAARANERPGSSVSKSDLEFPTTFAGEPPVSEVGEGVGSDSERLLPSSTAGDDLDPSTSDGCDLCVSESTCDNLNLSMVVHCEDKNLARAHGDGIRSSRLHCEDDLDSSNAKGGNLSPSKANDNNDGDLSSAKVNDDDLNSSKDSEDVWASFRLKDEILDLDDNTEIWANTMDIFKSMEDMFANTSSTQDDPAPDERPQPSEEIANQRLEKAERENGQEADLAASGLPTTESEPGPRGKTEGYVRAKDKLSNSSSESSKENDYIKASGSKRKKSQNVGRASSTPAARESSGELLNFRDLKTVAAGRPSDRTGSPSVLPGRHTAAASSANSDLFVTAAPAPRPGALSKHRAPMVKLIEPSPVDPELLERLVKEKGTGRQDYPAAGEGPGASRRQGGSKDSGGNSRRPGAVVTATEPAANKKTNSKMPSSSSFQEKMLNFLNREHEKELSKMQSKHPRK